jgi:DNA-binding response OmpR family regulator
MGNKQEFSATILVVDDEPAVRRFMSRALARDGYRVIETDGAGAARDAVQANHDSLRLIVCDIRMPGTGGLDFANELSQMGIDLPVLYVSGMAGSTVVEGISRSNPLVMLVKPFSAEELLRRVRAILRPECSENAPTAFAAG